MLSINAEFVKSFGYPAFKESGSLFRIEENDNSSFRVLSITDCSYQGVIDLLLSDNLHEILKKSTHCFWLTIQLNEASELNIEVLKTRVCNLFATSRKYFLVEIYQNAEMITRLIYYHSKVIGLVMEDFDTEDKENDDSYKVFKFCSMFLRDKSLLNCSLSMENYKTHIEESSKKSLPMLMRLLKLFKNDAQNEESVKEFMKSLITKSNIKTVEAYLDLSIVDEKKPLPLTDLSEKIINYVYENGESLLLIAAEKKDSDMVKLLLRLGASIDVTDSNNLTVADYAIKESKYESLKLLLDNDAKFPWDFRSLYDDFKQSDSTTKKAIAEISDERDKLHNAIQKGRLNEIDEFRKKNPSLRFAYKSDRNFPFFETALSTALKQAIDKDDYTIYVECLRKRFTTDPLEAFSIKDSVKNKINTFMLDKFKSQDLAHIWFLEAKTRVALGVDETEYRDTVERVRKIYQILNGIEEINDLLKILVHSKSLSIVVDPINKSVNKMDLKAKAGTDGLTYQNLGRIYVAIAGKKDEEIAGVIVHELTHFALQIIFNNSCNPYGVHDEALKNSFAIIVEEVKGRQENHQVIKQVFDNYKKTMWPSELIVRVPQLMALEKTRSWETDYHELYQYFMVKILPIAKNLTKSPERFRIRREVQQLNETLGHLEGIEKLGIWLSKSRLMTEMNDPKIQKLIICNTPRLVFADFYQIHVKPNLINWEAKNDKDGVFHVFASTEDFKSLLKAKYIHRIWSLTSDVTLVLKCENILEKMDHCNLLKTKKISENLVLIGSDEMILKSMIKKTRNDQRSTSFTINYEWDDIQAESKEELLQNTMISFQGVDISMSSLIDENFPSEKIPFKKLVNAEKIFIEASKVLIDHYKPDEFIERSFIGHDDLNSLLTYAKEQKLVLISGEPGIGKSVILSHVALKLKEENKEFWVTRVNLHEHTKALEEDLSCGRDAFSFISKNFIGAEEETDDCGFTDHVFEKLYNQGKVILLLDALDEVYPEGFKYCSSLIEELKTKGEVQLWITTRPHLKDDLKKLLGTNSTELKSFSKKDQMNYITNFWKKSLPKYKVTREELEFCADKVLSNFANSLDNKWLWSNIIELPLQTKMIAESFLDDIKKHFNGTKDISKLASESINIFDLYSKFVSTKIRIVNKEKGFAIELEKAHNEIMSRDIIHIHECLALRSKFRHKNQSDSQGYVYSDDHFDARASLMDLHQIQLYGMVCFDASGEPYFLHQSYAEFFVANFIAKSFLKNINCVQPPPQSTIAMEVLFQNVISIFQQERTLTMFVNVAFGQLLYGSVKDNTVSLTTPYLKKFVTKDPSNPEILTHMDYLVSTDSLFILNFVIECIGHLDKESIESFLTIVKFNIFMSSAKHCMKSIVKVIWKIAEKVYCDRKELQNFFLLTCSKEELYTSQKKEGNTKTTQIKSVFKKGYNAFQYAFIKLMECDSEVLKNYADINELEAVASKKLTFNEVIRRNSRKSTLKTLLEIANNLFDNDELGREIKKKLVLCNGSIGPSNTKINVRHFVDSLNEKWDVMIELNPDIIQKDWQFIATETLFGEIIFIIFHEFNIEIVRKFYYWAKNTRKLKGFEWLVKETFVKHLWRCHVDDVALEILTFIREEINLMEVIRENPEVVSNLLLLYVNEYPDRFERALEIIEKHFTVCEFETLVTSPDKDGNKIISALLKMHVSPRRLLKMLRILSKKGYDKQKFADIFVDTYDLIDLTKVFWKIFNEETHSSRCDVVSAVSEIQKIFPDAQIEQVLVSKDSENRSLFTKTAEMRPFFLMETLWGIARDQLDDEAFEELLLHEFNGFSITKATSGKEYLKQSPSFDNTFCCTASYDFIPYKWSDHISEHAISIDRQGESLVYIGQAFINQDLNKNYIPTLCEIIPPKRQIRRIGIDDNPYKLNVGELKLLVGEGLEWADFNEGSGKMFSFEQSYRYSFFLAKDKSNNLSLRLEQEEGYKFLTYADKSKTWKDGFIYCK